MKKRIAYAIAAALVAALGVAVTSAPAEARDTGWGGTK